MEFTINGAYTATSIQRTFAIGNPVWVDDKEMNRILLEIVHNSVRDIIEQRGWFTLNELYKLLGFPPTPEGAVVGWDKIPDKQDGTAPLFSYAQIGENYRFKENRWVIDFFVDGVIFCCIGVKEQ